MLSMIEKDTMFCWLQLKLDLVSITKSKYKLERTIHKKKQHSSLKIYIHLLVQENMDGYEHQILINC